MLCLTCLGILLMAKRYSLSKMQFPRALPKHLNKKNTQAGNSNISENTGKMWTIR